MTDIKAEKSPPNIGRIALMIAAVLAIAAVGVQLYKSYGGGAENGAGDSEVVAATSGETAPSVDQVIADLEQKLADNPDDAESWRMLGWSYFETEQFAEAANAMKRATTLDPDNAEYWSMLGETLVMASDGSAVPADAAQAFNKALAADANDARARYFLAVQKDMAGDHTGAINDWFALLADTPADAPYAEDIRRVIGQVAAKEGIDVKDRLVRAAPAAATGGMTTGGPARAAAAIPGPTSAQMRDAASLPPGQQEAMISDMVEGLDAKLKANPDNPDGWIMLMRSRMTLGQTVQAKQARDRALAVFKNDGAKAKKVREAASALGVI